MHNCSKEFLLKFSNPKMSRIPTFVPLSVVLQRREKGTNTLILLCNGTSKSPAAVSIDKTLMMIRVQPKYGVDPNSAAVWWETINSTLQKITGESFLSGFYWFNLQSLSISLQTMHISGKRCRSRYQPVSHAQSFCFSYAVIPPTPHPSPWIRGVTSSPTLLGYYP